MPLNPIFGAIAREQLRVVDADLQERAHPCRMPLILIGSGSVSILALRRKNMRISS